MITNVYRLWLIGAGILSWCALGWFFLSAALAQTLTMPEAKQLEAGMPTSVRPEALEGCDEIFPSIYECVVKDRGVIHFRKSKRTGRGVLLYDPFPRLKPDNMR